MASTSRSLALAAMLVAASPLGALAAADPQALAAFRAREGAAWDVSLDASSRRPRRLVGGAHPVDPNADAATAALAFLRDAAPVLALDASSLEPARDGVVSATGGTVTAVHFDVTSRGVPIEGARVTVAMARGRIVLASVVGAEPVELDVAPRVSAPAALRIARDATELAAAGPRDLDTEPVLRILRTETGPVLAWKVVLARALPPSRHVAFVDARDGSLLSLTDETISCALPPPAGGSPRRVLAGVRAHRADDPETTQPMAQADVGGVTSDDAGIFAGGGPAQASLAGPVAVVECVDCGNPESPLAPAGADGHADFGSGGFDATGNGLATPADRASYFHVERVRRQAGRWLSLPWLARPVLIRTNLPNACNAYWNGLALNFFRSSPACSNTGEIRDVISHEWGHGLDENDGLRPPGVSIDGATGEGVADIVAMLRSRDACIGESFYLTPADFPSAACSGVRDLDEHAPGQRRGILTSTTVTSECPPSAFYRGVLGREGHCEGELLGQAFFHLVRTLATGTSYGDGRVLATGLGDEAAWQVAEAIFYRSRPLLASQAPSTQQSIGVSAHDAFLVADDEGDGLANGTPHAWAIRDAFDHHELSEPAAPALTAPPCALAAPGVTVTAELDESTGLSSQRVAWTDAGAARYHVLRGDGDGAALQPVAPPAGPGAGSIADTGVLPGRVVRYVVVAEAAAGCLGTSVAVPAAPAPSLRVAGVRIDDAVLGDGDGRLSAGETADLVVDLANDGDAPLGPASVLLDAIDPALAILAAGPVAYGAIAPGATIAGPAPFRVRADANPPASVAFGVAATATEGCLRATRRLSIARPALTLASAVVDDATGDADGAWDPGERVGLPVTLRNDGDFAARNVTGALSFRVPPPAGVTITRAAASWGDMAPAVSLQNDPPDLTLDATAAVPVGSLVRLQLDVQVAAAPHRTFFVDLVVGGMAAGRLEWQVDMGAIPGLGTGEIVNQPLVVQASDDDGDGAITSCDVPDIVVETWNVGGIDKFVILSGDDGRVLGQFPVTPCRSGWGVFETIAAGDVNGDGVPEIVTDDDGTPCALSIDGTLLWRSPARARVPEWTMSAGNAAPQVWDMDGDGTAEVVIGRAVINGEDGSIQWTSTATRDSGRSLVGDVDLDGRIDVIGFPGDVTAADGSVIAGRFPGFGTHGGLVNLDATPEAEVVYLAGPGTATASIVARSHDGALLWEWPKEAPHDFRMPPCFGDFDGDGRAETALPAGPEILMFDDDGSLDWRLPVADTSGASGCSVFDFDGDHRPEILHRDENTLRIINGESGLVLWQVPCRSVTHHEYPVVADLDNDGSAEVVIHETAGGNRSTLRVYGNPAWGPARGIWNQEAYSVTNVGESGSVVSAPAARWLTANDFRGQAPACPCATPGLELSADVACGQFTACFLAVIDGGAAPFEITWDFGDGSVVQAGAEPCHDYAAPGRYIVRASLVDAFTCTAVATIVVDVPDALAVSVTGTPACPGVEACFTAVATGGMAPLDIAWSFEGAAPSAAGPSACHSFAGPSFTIDIFVRDALGCLATATYADMVDPRPSNVGSMLFVYDHGSPLAPLIEATLDWTGDRGLPRPPDESYRILRGTLPTVLSQVPGTAGHLPVTYRDATPADPARSPVVHFYVVLAEDACGSVSDD